MYDIRRTPSEMTGYTPFEKMFGRPMRTRIDVKTATESSDLAPRMKPRDMTETYEKKKAVVRNYQIGDKVLARRGSGLPFTHTGEVMERRGIATYMVRFGDRISMANQCNLKPLLTKVREHDDFDEIQAYEDARQRLRQPVATEQNQPDQVQERNQPVQVQDNVRRSTRVTKKPDYLRYERF